MLKETEATRLFCHIFIISAFQVGGGAPPGYAYVIHQVASATTQQRDPRVKLRHLPTCLPHMVEASHCSFLLLTVKQESCEYQFYSLWFDPTGFT